MPGDLGLGELIGALALIVSAVATIVANRRAARIEQRRLELQEADGEGRALERAWARIEKLESELRAAQAEARREREARERLEADVERMREALRQAGVDGF